MALPLLWLGLLSCVLMEVMKMPVEEGLCTPVPCRLEFPKEFLNNSTITGYWLNKNINSAVATSKLNAAIDDNTSERFHIIWNLEERDCTLLTHNVLRRDNMAYLSLADRDEQKSTLLRENITLFLSDRTQKPKLYIPDIPVAGKPVALTCTIRGSCIETKALFLSWKERTMSFNTDGSRNSSSSSSVLHTIPKPKDHGTTLQCHLNFSLPNLTRTSKISPIIPTSLFYHTCTLEKILECRCSFFGIPTPVVYWVLEGVPVHVKNMSNVLQVTTTITTPWANSTIHLLGEPETVMNLYCEAQNQYGNHSSTVFLIPDESSILRVFIKGLIQGIVYGGIVPALFFFFLVLLVMKIFKWWAERQIPRDEEALIPEKPELGKEPETSEETKAETSSISAGGDSRDSGFSVKSLDSNM